MLHLDLRSASRAEGPCGSSLCHAKVSVMLASSKCTDFIDPQLYSPSGAHIRLLLHPQRLDVQLHLHSGPHHCICKYGLSWLLAWYADLPGHSHDEALAAYRSTLYLGG